MCCPEINLFRFSRPLTMSCGDSGFLNETVIHMFISLRYTCERFSLHAESYEHVINNCDIHVHSYLKLQFSFLESYAAITLRNTVGR